MTSTHAQRVSRTITEAESASTATVLTVAEALDVEPTELEPLARTVDPDALDDLFSDPGAPTRLSFTYEGIRVTLRGDDVVAVGTPSGAGVERDALG